MFSCLAEFRATTSHGLFGHLVNEPLADWTTLSEGEITNGSKNATAQA